MKKRTSGRVTLPSEQGFTEGVKTLIERFGADAVRDSDGTKLSEDDKALPVKKYATYFVSRGHNDFAREHPEARQHIVLMSERRTAHGDKLEIRLTDGYLSEQVEPDRDCDIRKYWSVTDFTKNEDLPPDKWRLSDTDEVEIDSERFHEYAVSFLAWAKWDPTQMYNYITNDWQGKEKDIPIDIRSSAAWEYAKGALEAFLAAEPEIDVVRFTTFFYHFTLLYSSEKREKYVDWFGYTTSVSPECLDEFEREYGYRLTASYLADGGSYHTYFKPPDKKFRDFSDFISRFACSRAAELVRITHSAGREAMMFFGDNWIGCEPYGEHFGKIGLDAVVGSVGNGTTLRLISDIEGVSYTEGRFLPYFFPDTFREGGNPAGEALENWLSARRAILRRPVDRIGYGGYPSLACAFPDFLDTVESICNEFRDIYSRVKGQKAFTAAKVAVINCWGRLRSWQTHMVAHAKPYPETEKYAGVLEALSGMAVEVVFLSFDEIIEKGIPSDIDCLINAGDGGTAFSGGEVWADSRLVTEIREFVYSGGGFIGIGEPSAFEHGGRYFQLADVMGVECERGFTLSCDKYFTNVENEHFITDGITGRLNFGICRNYVYALYEKCSILAYGATGVEMAAHSYGGGRSVYLQGLPYSHENTRLLYRSILYASNKESAAEVFECDNCRAEVSAYPTAGFYAIANNSCEQIETIVRNGEGESERIRLRAGEIVWRDIE